jgi:glutaryl-CoA dehydrogenase
MAAIKFRGVDFIELDTLLNDDERLVRDTARRFIEDNLVPIIEECNRAGRFPRELVKPMADLGFFGASLNGYGCAGMSNVEYGLVTQELERGDSGVRSFVSVQSALVMYPIHAFGSDQQKNTWLPAMQKGEKLGCFGLTEPDFGSNPGGMRTRAKKVGKEYVLNGEKMWITSGTIADVAVIWAKVEDEDNQVRGFLVETDRPGFKANDIHGKWSLRASVTSGLSLQDVRIPESNLLPGSGGLKSPLMCLNQARYGIAWGAINRSHRTNSCRRNWHG